LGKTNAILNKISGF
jgi:hypothetical protein